MPAGNPGRRRSIPACAGEPSPTTTRPTRSMVYPRVCGGTEPPAPEPPPIMGLSPRVRGNQKAPLSARAMSGSIPACAGEPCTGTPPPPPPTVYPRVCGGTGDCSPSKKSPPGLSPRVRGNHRLGQPPVADRRSIPACAGEPQTPLRWRDDIRVYPRVCGGTSKIIAAQECAGGLSPRVRGNLAPGVDDVVLGGSIPACAGEPWW